MVWKYNLQSQGDLDQTNITDSQLEQVVNGCLLKLAKACCTVQMATSVEWDKQRQCLSGAVSFGTASSPWQASPTATQAASTSGGKALLKGGKAAHQSAEHLVMLIVK